MLLQTLVRAEPPSKKLSNFEKRTLNVLKANRNVWFLLSITSEATLVPSFLADHRNIEIEVGIRRDSDMDPAVLEAFRKQSINLIAHKQFYCLWGRYITRSGTNKSSATPSISDSKRYPKQVRDLTARLYNQAKVYNPETLSDDKSKNKDWLDPMLGMVEVLKGGGDTIAGVLDFIFGKEDGSTEPDTFWSTVVDSPTVLSNNLSKIADAKHKARMRSDKASAPKKDKRNWGRREEPGMARDMPGRGR